MKWSILFISILLLLIIYTGIEHNKKDPDMEYILKNFEEFNNTEVTFVGKVISVTNQSMEIKLIGAPYTCLSINVKNVSAENGDIVEITGILDGREHVTAEKIIVSRGWKYDLIFIRSIPAIPFALYFFLRRWKFNFKKFMFEEKNA